jgi:hypothetical protein
VLELEKMLHEANTLLNGVTPPRRQGPPSHCGPAGRCRRLHRAGIQPAISGSGYRGDRRTPPCCGTRL